jgi:hypothetical protein
MDVIIIKPDSHEMVMAHLNLTALRLQERNNSGVLLHSKVTIGSNNVVRLL